MGKIESSFLHRKAALENAFSHLFLPVAGLVFSLADEALAKPNQVETKE